jgi:hypothetical protein
MSRSRRVCDQALRCERTGAGQPDLTSNTERPQCCCQQDLSSARPQCCCQQDLSPAANKTSMLLPSCYQQDLSAAANKTSVLLPTRPQCCCHPATNKTSMLLPSCYQQDLSAAANKTSVLLPTRPQCCSNQNPRAATSTLTNRPDCSKQQLSTRPAK